MKKHLINFLVLTMITSTVAGGATLKVGATTLESQNTIVSEVRNVTTNYEDLRNQWVNELTGNASFDESDEDMKLNIASLDKQVLYAINNINEIEEGSMVLWNDIEDKTSKSATMTAHFKRIKSMAIAYKSLGSEYYNNSELLALLTSSINFMYDRYYNERVTSRPNNWWDWEIGSPRELSEITILLYEELGEFRNNLVATLEHFVPDPKTRLNGIVETGANRVDKALIVALYALSGENSEKIALASDALLQVFPYVTSGDGFYKDGSFVQHSNIAYTGSYGLVLINSLANALLLIQQTEHAVTDKEYYNMYSWIRDSYAPFVSKGGNIIDNVRGRAISRESEQGNIRGKLLISSLLKIAQIAPESETQYIESMCKTWVKEGASLSNTYFAGMNNNDIGVMKNLINDNGVEAAGSENYYKQFYYMDRMMSKRPEYSFSVGMSSTRIANYESINSESLKAWYTGQGMTQIYNNDINQYNEDFWPTVDPYRLPGVTTDGKTRDKSTSNASAWTGGTTIDGINGVSGMEINPAFKTTQGVATKMSARKSWFAFEDEIVALGSNISSEDSNVETIVENRKIKDDASNDLIINGERVTENVGDAESLNADWAYLDGNVENSGIGYVFPTTTEVSIKRETRTHSWDEINAKLEFATYDKKTKSYVSLALNHGNEPKDSKYEYILLPNKTEEETKEYSENQRVEVIANTNELHGVYHKDEKIAGFNAWVAGDITENMSVNSPASIMVKETEEGAKISIAEPTRLLQSQVLTLKGDEIEGYDIEVSDDIVVEKVQDGYELTINTSNRSGESHYINLVRKNIVVGKVTNFKATSINSDNITLNWNKPEENVGLVEYIIYKDGKELVRLDKNTTEHTIDSLRKNTIYGMKIVARYANGAESKPVSLNIRTTK